MTLTRTLAVLALGLATLPAHAIVYNPRAPLVRVYSLYNAAQTDQLLTTDAAESSRLIATGWWVSTGDVFFLEPRAQVTTRPLYGFYKGPPQREHFYTTIQSEADAVPGLGYGAQVVVGHAYATSLPGTVPLHRLTRFDGATGDLVHRYTVSEALRASLIAQGHGYEGVVGYVYVSPFPAVTGGVVMGARCTDPGRSCSEVGRPSFRDDYFGLFNFTAAVPAKPANAVSLNMSFRVWSPDFFGSRDHVIINPRARNPFNPAALERSALSGMALVLASENSFGCTPASSTFVEQFWPTPSGPLGWASHNFVPASCGRALLSNNVSYDVYLSAANDGTLSYSVFSGGAGVASGSARYSPFLGGTFDATAVGAWFSTAASSHRDYTLYLTNVAYQWQLADPGCRKGAECP